MEGRVVRGAGGRKDRGRGVSEIGLRIVSEAKMSLRWEESGLIDFGCEEAREPVVRLRLLPYWMLLGGKVGARWQDDEGLEMRVPSHQFGSQGEVEVDEMKKKSRSVGWRAGLLMKEEG